MTKPKQSINKQSINLVTGEIIENEIQAKESIKQLQKEKKENKQFLDNNVKCIKDTFNLNDEELIFQKDRFFFKLYKKFYNEYIYDLSPHTVKVFMFLVDNLNHKDNSIVINGKFPSQDEMVEKSGIPIKSFKKAISELVSKNIIVSERHRHIRKIYINPQIIEDDKTERVVHNKFK